MNWHDGTHGSSKSLDADYCLLHHSASFSFSNLPTPKSYLWTLLNHSLFSCHGSSTLGEWLTVERSLYLVTQCFIYTLKWFIDKILQSKFLMHTFICHSSIHNLDHCHLLCKWTIRLQYGERIIFFIYHGKYLLIYSRNFVLHSILVINSNDMMHLDTNIKINKDLVCQGIV